MSALESQIEPFNKSIEMTNEKNKWFLKTWNSDQSLLQDVNQAKELEKQVNEINEKVSLLTTILIKGPEIV